MTSFKNLFRLSQTEIRLCFVLDRTNHIDKYYNIFKKLFMELKNIGTII